MIKRILKMLSVLSATVGITIATQFLLPPAFLHFYGVRRYGEWLVLSATVSYLGTLKFGISTYASNELTILRKRGEMERFRELQGSTFALQLFVLFAGVAISLLAFVLPLSRLLHLSSIAPLDLSLTVFFLSLQAMTGVATGYYTDLFMVVEMRHRGENWFNALRLSVTIIAILLATLRVRFCILAIGQFAIYLIVALLTIRDLKKQMGKLPLGLGGANWKTAKAALAPSGMFGMIFAQQFLVFQAPMILLQWIVGPELVVLFSISRTILSTARQLLQVITTAISPEITFAFADRDMKKLLNIFHYSEKIVFAVIPVANLGAFLCSPLLLEIWLRKPRLFDPFSYALMALISAAMSMREHKQYFQYSTNTHKRLAIISFFGNLAMIAASIPATMQFGLPGFLFAWLFSELAQMGLIYFENKRLFHADPSINFIPVLKLGGVMAVSLPLCWVAVEFARRHSLGMVGMVAAGGILVLSVESYFVFGIRDVWDEWQRRRQRMVSDIAPGVA